MSGQLPCFPWKLCKSSSGADYYFNIKTKQSAWTLPVDETAAAKNTPERLSWKRHSGDSQRPKKDPFNKYVPVEIPKPKSIQESRFEEGEVEEEITGIYSIEELFKEHDSEEEQEAPQLEIVSSSGQAERYSKKPEAATVNALSIKRFAKSAKKATGEEEENASSGFKKIVSLASPTSEPVLAVVKDPIAIYFETTDDHLAVFRLPAQPASKKIEKTLFCLSSVDFELLAKATVYTPALLRLAEIQTFTQHGEISTCTALARSANISYLMQACFAVASSK